MTQPSAFPSFNFVRSTLEALRQPTLLPTLIEQRLADPSASTYQALDPENLANYALVTASYYRGARSGAILTDITLAGAAQSLFPSLCKITGVEGMIAGLRAIGIEHDTQEATVMTFFQTLSDQLTEGMTEVVRAYPADQLRTFIRLQNEITALRRAANIGYDLGVVLYDLGRSNLGELALPLFRELISYRRALGTGLDRENILHDVATIALKSNLGESTLTLLTEIIDAEKWDSDWRFGSSALQKNAVAFSKAGFSELALKACAILIANFRNQTKMPFDRGNGFSIAADCYCRCGFIDEGVALFQEAIQIAKGDQKILKAIRANLSSASDPRVSTVYRQLEGMIS